MHTVKYSRFREKAHTVRRVMSIYGFKIGSHILNISNNRYLILSFHLNNI
jgi:hypothetical protein